MPLLTVEMVNLNALSRQWGWTDYDVLRPGAELAQQGRVSVVAFTGETAACQVRDGQSAYTVAVEVQGNGQVAFRCECRRARQGRHCVHMAAAAQALGEYIATVARKDWRYRLRESLGPAPAPRTARAHMPYLLLIGLSYSLEYGFDSRPFQVCYVSARHWPALVSEVPRSPEEYLALLDSDDGWRDSVARASAATDIQNCLNLPAAEAAFLRYSLMRNDLYAYGSIEPAPVLAWLAKWHLPAFLRGPDGDLGPRLDLSEAPATVEATLNHVDEGLLLETGLRLSGRLIPLSEGGLGRLSANPTWVYLGRHLARVSNPEALNLMQLQGLSVPPDEVEAFREQFVPRLAERVPISGDVLAWEEVDAPPVPRLYLNDAEGTLHAELRFAYGDAEVPCERNPEEAICWPVPGTWRMVRARRRPEQEQARYSALADAAYGLKRAGREHGYGAFALRARTHPFDFLSRCVPLLTQAGFEIYGEEKLKIGRVNRHTPTVSLGLSSGIDWFDVQAVVQYGDQQVSLWALRGALRKGERYVKLADGSVGEVPEAWLRRYRRLFDLAEETADGRLRLTDVQLPLLDPLLDDAALVQADDAFDERRNRLRDFRAITPQPVPAGFVGELRPYQKAGLDWLHFLHEYGFGGCLADDMGLGKTIQVLALLQSLREQGKAQGASLLVVPKSLLVNWQREAARFTPELRFLEYTGNTRIKDAAAFAGYDVILTTYGVLLRDVGLLRQTHFDYAILDESQTIKNPLAKSARAVRLLAADHRLVLTGTPVENSTFELWSQFAYLNPGLLGNLEYFKREFATPIERHGDEEAADLLRRLVYPFILRRTKEQVAPELPPRTERVLYVDMEPAQRKIYQHTRETYRQMLLGMIEGQGMDDTRMKILEGLLRLRQVSIHPALLEPTYRGEAPKFELLLETLATLRAEGHKALVFSHFVQVLTLLRAQLDEQGLRYAYLDGSTQDRQAQVDVFQNDPLIPFFLISTRAGGLGLNLTAADYVVHLDPWWNPAVERQANDRAHRIGQDRPVIIYRLITRDSVEEKILVLQERKQQLVDQLISSEGGFFKSLTTEDVQSLFS